MDETLKPDPGCEILICIPFVVLIELDDAKGHGGRKGKNAREFVRILDEIEDKELFKSGIEIADGVGIKVSDFDPCGKTVDEKILQTAKGFERGAILLTNDVNLRIRARQSGIKTIGLMHEEVSLIPEIEKIEWISEELISKLYSGGTIVPDQIRSEHIPNKNYILKNGSISILATTKNGRIEKVSLGKYYGVGPKNTEQTFALNALMDDDIPLVTLTGKAGSGKTLISLAAAMASKRSYQKILIARPAIPLSGKDTGYLPGDIGEKLEPYMRPLYDNLMILDSLNPDRKSFREYIEAGKIEVCPLAYIRGRSLPRVFFVVDEAQNLTVTEIKTIITRAGEGAKIVLTGDMSQIDRPGLSKNNNGLLYLIEKMAGRELAAHVSLKKSERSKLAELAADIL